MSINKKKIMTFLILGTILLSGCQKKSKGEQINGAYVEYPPTETLSVIESVPEETIEIMPSFNKEQNVDHSQNETLANKEETIAEKTDQSDEEPVQEVDETIEQQSHSQKSDNITGTINTPTNIYSSHSTDTIIISQLEIYETAYKVLSYDNNWDLVRYNDKLGYVLKEFIDYKDSNYEFDYKHIKYNDIAITTGSLNFRTEPSIDSERITTLSPNTELEVLAKVEDSEWLLVKYNSQLGYVHGDYVTSMLERANYLYPELQLSSLECQKVVYSTTSLNFRSGNSTEFPSLGLLEKYETLRVIKEYDDWYFVMTNDYNFGFVSANYTENLEERFVIVDKSEQQLFLYDDNELLYTTPVTTGKDATPSDTGLFKIYYKGTNEVLTDYQTYWSKVRYWMPYNAGEGLHDADWRTIFGTDSYHYNGSHGCINMPVDITDEIYNNVEVGTKVLVHK